MKEIRGMKRGVKLEPQPTNSQRILALDKELKNLQMAGRIQQMMVQQLMNNLQNMAKDLGKAFGTVNELQYKILAIQAVGAERGILDAATLQARADELRLKDFNEASDAEDVSGNFIVGNAVEENSTVIVTSTTQDGAGFFRSRIKLMDSGSPALIEGLMGKPVGTKVKCTLNGSEHEVELLGIRNPPPVVVAAPEVAAVPVSPVEVYEDGSESQTFVQVSENGTVH